jgi:drug/metabolite transporter (DMT)-like permease
MLTAWVLLGLAVAVLSTSSDLFSKRALARGWQPLSIALWRQLLAVPVLAPLLLRGIPTLDATFWGLHAIFVPIDALALFLYFYSVKHAPLSLSVPLSSSAMIVAAFSAAIFLGEWITLPAGLGIALVITGSYVLNLRPAETGWLGPIRALRSQPGVRAMLAAAMLYGLNAVPFKMALVRSDPLYFSFHYLLVMSIVLALVARRTTSRPPPGTLKQLVLPAALCFALMTACQALAVSQAHIVYVGALKRLAGPLSVMFGWLVLAEISIRMRALGSLMIFSGCVLIAWGG